jgi:formylglycine-generating enzyme required for sulfatase activity/predicted MPP superfamily phosphohydrolase
MSKVTILHLSDIHFKRKENETFREDVQGKMIAAIKKHLDKYRMEPDFAAVTGDIAFSGKEYEEAKVFFKELKSVLPVKTRFLVVPGNHDVDREKISKFFSLYSIVQYKKVDDFLEDKGEINTHINPKLKAFREFTDTLKPKLYKEEDDYFWVKDFNDENVSFLGLNSCWACEGDNDRNNITLGYPQVMKALKESKIPNKIALMHHPPNWLNEIDFNRYNGEIFHQCQLILNGHTHADNALVFKNPAGSCICLGANASYADDKEDGFIGFQFIEVEFRKDGIGVKVWPYRLDKRGMNRFVSDHHRWEGHEGPFFELKTFKMKKPLLPLEIPKEYKDWIRQFHSTMDIELLAKKGEAIIVDLPELYIPIETSNPFFKSTEDESETKKGFKSKEPRFIDIEILVSRKKRVLLRGGAGMGKTTLIKHLAYTVCNDSCCSLLKGFLPVMIFLKDLWLIYRKELTSGERKLGFEDVIEPYLEKITCKLTWEIVEAFLSQQKALFLIDGLDEVPEPLRTNMVDMIAQFQFEHRENHFLITGRPHVITGRVEEQFEGDLHDIDPLDYQKVDDFIKKWFRAISGRAYGRGELTAQAMISDIRGYEYISVFTQNPLLLTALCILYQEGKRIPEQRADLYKRIIDNLIHRRFHDSSHPKKEIEILEFLMALAFDAQKKSRKVIELDHAKEILKKTFPKREDEIDFDYELRIQGLFNEIEPGCGLFHFLSNGEIEFNHLTFQEFLAAKHMVYMDVDWQQFLEKEWWEETLLLYTGFINIDRKKASNEVIKTILTDIVEKEAENKKRRRLQFLSAEALCDFHPAKRDEAVVSLSRTPLIQLMESDSELEDRLWAGELVGGLGDTRLKGNNMVLVPAGEFIRGSNEFNEEEKPEQCIYLDGFKIGMYPVANQEFKQFLDDKGYQQREFWKPKGWQWLCSQSIAEPLFWNNRARYWPNFPVKGISWYEASAYANWLKKLTGKPYRLPTEAEWEKAARSTDGRIYPWGNEFDKNFCNSWELGLRRSNPVGIFPNGKSPYGCIDMVGNVWEWCSDWFEEEYYRERSKENPMGPSKGFRRVLRGGSFCSGELYCRVTHRHWQEPEFQGDDIGFRLVIYV